MRTAGEGVDMPTGVEKKIQKKLMVYRNKETRLYKSIIKAFEWIKISSKKEN